MTHRIYQLNESRSIGILIRTVRCKSNVNKISKANSEINKATELFKLLVSSG